MKVLGLALCVAFCLAVAASPAKHARKHSLATSKKFAALEKDEHSLEENPKPTLRLYFDINKTILMSDSVTGKTPKNVIYATIAEQVWVKSCETPERISKELSMYPLKGKEAHPNYLSCAKSASKKKVKDEVKERVKDELEKRMKDELEKKVKDELEKKVKDEVEKKVKDDGLEKKVLDELVKTFIDKNDNLKTLAEEMSEKLDERDQGVVESFETALRALNNNEHYKSLVVMMTFGDDIPILFAPIMKMAGQASVGRKSLAEKTGQWLRFDETPAGTSLSMMNEKGMVTAEMGFDDIDLLLHAKASEEGCKPAKAKKDNRKLVCNENGYTGKAGIIFTRNHYNPWAESGKASSMGKPILQGENTIAIFFDDNLDERGHKNGAGKLDEASIGVMWKKEEQGEKMIWKVQKWENVKDKQLFRADPIQATQNKCYFVDLINQSLKHVLGEDAELLECGSDPSAESVSSAAVDSSATVEEVEEVDFEDQ